jgi:hypothetical protein
MATRTPLGTTATAVSNQPDTWFESFKRQGLYFRYAALITIISGLYVHVTRLFLGDDLLVQFVVTLLFDKLLILPMTYAAVSGLLGWHWMQFQNIWHKLALGGIILYITLSVPLHIYVSYYVLGSTRPLTAFPLAASYGLLPMYVGMLVLLGRLRFKENVS